MNRGNSSVVSLKCKLCLPKGLIRNAEDKGMYTYLIFKLIITNFQKQKEKVIYIVVLSVLRGVVRGKQREVLLIAKYAVPAFDF